MFRFFTAVLVVYVVVKLLGGVVTAFGTAAVEVFGAIEAAAVQSQQQFDTTN